MVKACHLGRAYTPLAGHELVPVEDLGYEHWLQNAVDGDAARQGFESSPLNLLSRLVGIASDPRDGYLDGRPSGRSGLWDQSLKPTSQAGVPLARRRCQPKVPSAAPG